MKKEADVSKERSFSRAFGPKRMVIVQFPVQNGLERSYLVISKRFPRPEMRATPVSDVETTILQLFTMRGCVGRIVTATMEACCLWPISSSLRPDQCCVASCVTKRRKQNYLW